jgi:hypothetical protein
MVAPNPRRRARLAKDQLDVTQEQLDAAVRFVSEHIRLQVSSEPADEEAAETALREAYVAVGVEPPGHIHWLDGPLELVALLTSTREVKWLDIDEEYRERVPHCAWDDATLDRDEIEKLDYRAGQSLDYRIREARTHADREVDHAFGGGTEGDGISKKIWRQVDDILWEPLQWLIGDRLWRELCVAAGWPVGYSLRHGEWYGADFSLWHAIAAYDSAPSLIGLLYFDTYLAPNQAGPLARLNEQVSGYWFGKNVAFVVRKPRILARDERGLLHNAQGKAIEYVDGWGFWAWHGVRVPERAITTPTELLTREDFLNESNLEVRRVFQERMGERFLWTLGAHFIEGGPRGILYEVDLPQDPERVARYVQVDDPSTGRMYYLRVPRRIATAEEAVAWTFGMTVDEYGPSEES